MKKTKKFNLKFYLNTRRELVYAVSLALISAVLVLSVILPQVAKMLRQNSALAGEDKKITSLRKKVADLDVLRVGTEMKKLEMLDRVLPSEKPLLEVLAQLGNISQLTRVKVDNLQLSPGVITKDDQPKSSKVKKSVNDYGNLDLEMTVSGPFNQVKRFMVLIEQIAPFTTIKSFSLNQNKSNLGESEANQVSVQLKITTYFYTKDSLASGLKASSVKLSEKDLSLLNDVATFKFLSSEFQPSETDNLEDLFGVNSWQDVKVENVSRYLRNQSQPSPVPPPSSL